MKCKKFTWELSQGSLFNNDDYQCNEDQAYSCCGVLEIADMPFGQDNYPMEHAICNCDNMNCDDMDRPEPRPASWKLILKAYQEMERDWRTLSGLVVVYLRKEQEKGGWIGQLFRDAGFESLGKFWNPKTRETLYHYRKVLRSGPPRSSKKKKSIFS